MQLRCLITTLVVSGLWSVFSTAICSAGTAADSLRDKLLRMARGELRTDSVWVTDGLVIEHADCWLQLEAGRVAFFDPVALEGEDQYFAAYYEGKGRIRFLPPVTIEREQLRRFFGSDSLNREVDGALLLFDRAMYDRIRAGSRATGEKPPKRMITEGRLRLRDLTKDENYSYVFTAMRALLEPQEKPLLVINCKPKKTDRLMYVYSPFSSEEVALWREYRAPGADFFELVNSYAEGLDETYERINGTPKGRLAALHYELDSRIDRNGNFIGEAGMTLRAFGDTTRLARLYLHPELRVDSVLDEGGRPVPFVRHKDKDHRRPDLYLLLPEEISGGDTLGLRIYSEGEIAKAQAGVFDVTAGGQWYPHLSYHQHATFDMTFRTPSEYEFVAVGEEVGHEVVGDTLVTIWKVGEPTPNVSFAIGPMEKYEFGNEMSGPVDVYYSAAVHERASWGRAGYESLTKDIEKQVAEDVVGAAELYSWMFGPRPYDRLKVTEVFSYHGEAFPGMLHLGVQTWFKTDQWGNERLFRAHETAHQWWGVAVGYESYHDQWLSEAFAQYAAWKYLQQIDPARARKILEEWRDEIFSVRNYGFGLKGSEAGPIILGPRTASSKTEGDYQLIVYKKGAFVLRMLEEMVDPEFEDSASGSRMTRAGFETIMQRFYSEFQGKQASTDDFQRIVENEVGEEMDWFFRQWVYGTGIPSVTVQWTKGQNDSGWYVDGRVTFEGVDSTFRMPVDAYVYTGRSGRIWLSAPVDSFRIEGIRLEPEKLFFEEPSRFPCWLARIKIQGP